MNSFSKDYKQPSQIYDAFNALISQQLAFLLLYNIICSVTISYVYVSFAVCFELILFNVILVQNLLPMSLFSCRAVARRAFDATGHPPKGVAFL